MTRPLVSVLWLNYNSKPIMDIVLRSLQGIVELDYPNYELIVVDNGSTDGSASVIREYLAKTRIKWKMIMLEKNLGFTGGNNVAYRARSKESKYIVLLNNDAIPFPDSLSKLVECVEQDEKLAAAQGLILDMKTRKIQSAVALMNELLISYGIFEGLPPESMKKVFYPTQICGCYSIYKIDSLKKATGYADKIFEDEMFAYFDDKVVGPQLWDAGYSLVSCPFKAALHMPSSTFGYYSPLKMYLIARGFAAFNEITNSRYKKIIRNIILTRKAILESIVTTMGEYTTARRHGIKYTRIKHLPEKIREQYIALYKGFRSGIIWGRNWVLKRNRIIDIYKAPLLKQQITEAAFQILTGVFLDYLKTYNNARITEKYMKNYIGYGIRKH